MMLSVKPGILYIYIYIYIYTYLWGFVVWQCHGSSGHSLFLFPL